MKSLYKILVASMVVLSPSVAFADFSRHHDDDCKPSYGNHNSGYSNGWWNNSGHSYNQYHNGNWSKPRPASYGWMGQDNRALQYGIRSGKLTKNELRELEKDKRELSRDQARYAADGYLSNGERRELREDYQDYQHDLQHELNDGERRW